MRKPVSDPIKSPTKPRVWRVLGPGLITGASDDDPSGIATYSQAGAQFGYGLGWTMLFTYPLMTAVQEISAVIGRTTGRGLAGNIREHYPGWLLQSIVLLLCVANIINIGADLGAMADALHLVAGGPQTLYVALFAGICVGLEIFVQYNRYVAILKWLTLSLFAYFGTALVVNLPWDEVLRGIFIPSISADLDFWTTVVAIFGTTISPYLFFWQASQEAEDQRVKPKAKPLLKTPKEAPTELIRIRIDTYVGMAFSNIVALAIIVTTAATLHSAGVSNIETSSQAAEALKPVAGNLAFFLFALGIIGTGMLAVPVLAGASAYAVGEARKWPVGLGRKPERARGFYWILAIATLVGGALNFTPINPIKALYWSAVINGVVAVPVMAIMMLMSGNTKIMGKLNVKGASHFMGWVATLVMTAAVCGMILTSFL